MFTNVNVIRDTNGIGTDVWRIVERTKYSKTENVFVKMATSNSATFASSGVE